MKTLKMTIDLYSCCIETLYLYLQTHYNKLVQIWNIFKIKKIEEEDINTTHKKML